MRKRELALLSLVIPMLLGFAAAEARACSCLPLPPPAEALASAPAVFEGELREDRLTASGSARDMQFLVLRAWKGVAAGEVVEVRTPSSSASCGHDSPWSPGLRLLIYASSNEGLLYMYLCSRTTNIAYAGDDIAALGPATSTYAPGTTDASPPPHAADAGCGDRPAGCTDASASVDAGSANSSINGGKSSEQAGCAVGSAGSAFWLAPVLIVGLLAALRRRRSNATARF